MMLSPLPISSRPFNTSFVSRVHPPPCLTLFPYTTLFRSVLAHQQVVGERPDLRVPIGRGAGDDRTVRVLGADLAEDARSEEHTSELQSRGQLVCRLLLEKKKNR